MNRSLLHIIVACMVIAIAHPVSLYFKDEVVAYWTLYKIATLILVTGFIYPLKDKKEIIGVLGFSAVILRWVFKAKIESPDQYSVGEWIYLGIVALWAVLALRAWDWNWKKFQLYYFYGIVLLIVVQVLHCFVQ